jgi:Na+/proline symporter
MEQVMGTAVGGIGFLLWLVMMVGMIAAWILFLVAIWRGMKAHESIAESMKQIAQK